MKKEDAPVSYVLVEADGLKKILSTQTSIQEMLETFQKKVEELKEALPFERKLYTAAEAAMYLGVSVPYLRKDCSEGPRKGRTPGPDPIKIGGMVRYTREDLDAWIERHRKRRYYPN